MSADIVVYMKYKYKHVFVQSLWQRYLHDWGRIFYSLKGKFIVQNHISALKQ